MVNLLAENCNILWKLLLKWNDLMNACLSICSNQIWTEPEVIYDLKEQSIISHSKSVEKHNIFVFFLHENWLSDNF